MSRKSLLVTALFFVAAVSLSGVLPLWLDEIIQLRQTRNTTPAQLIQSVPLQPGAAPLGYLVQQASLRITGYSVRWARFPSAVFAAGTVAAVSIFGAQTDLEEPWLAAALLASLPIVLRYACESRIYSQALFFSSLSSLMFMRLMKKPGWLQAAGYGFVLTAAVYTQPYTIFVGIAHSLCVTVRREFRAAALAALGVVAAGAAFLPWFLQSEPDWSSGVVGAGLHFVYSAKTPLMLFREISGAGYWGSGLLLILCLMAVARRRCHTLLLILLILVPTVLAIAADGVSGYFIATRQILWVLPAVAVLAARAFYKTNPTIQASPQTAPAPLRSFYNANPIAWSMATILILVSAIQTFRYFTAPHENWQIAADALAGEVKTGACLVVVPKEQALSYEFFRPDLAASHCPAPETVVAFTPYATEDQRRNAVSSLNEAGYSRKFTREAGLSEIALFAR